MFNKLEMHGQGKQSFINVELNIKPIRHFCVLKYNFQFDFCDFNGKTEGGLKTQVRNWTTCSFCNFSSKYESEIVLHVNKFKCTHRIEKITEYIYQMNQEIVEMKKRWIYSKLFG